LILGTGIYGIAEWVDHGDTWGQTEFSAGLMDYVDFFKERFQLATNRGW